ncbi:hypothetical protein Patl1_23171 [Pistacia atlantica]|uniref:Uncharacterized protein n=1 Tax=Pistacia atlantica TaxID=434234 RepID=A0ACC1A1Q3_9ROSI|nr:hypothetical protein Patl1_23171 [Pistacia atlantica]
MQNQLNGTAPFPPKVSGLIDIATVNSRNVGILPGGDMKYECRDTDARQYVENLQHWKNKGQTSQSSEVHGTSDEPASVPHQSFQTQHADEAASEHANEPASFGFRQY